MNCMEENKFKKVRSITGLSQHEFSRKYHIPRRTYEDWESGKRHAPIYVMELLEFRVRYDYECINERKAGTKS